MKLLIEALGEALALVDKATPGELFVYDANEGDGWPPHPLWCFKNAAYDSDDEEAQVVQGSLHYSGKEDADALVAAINFLRQHGPAIAAALRAVEGAATGRVDMLCASDAVVVDEIAEDRMLALHKQRVALVPLDAAGSAEGVGGG